MTGEYGDSKIGTVYKEVLNGTTTNRLCKIDPAEYRCNITRIRNRIRRLLGRPEYDPIPKKKLRDTNFYYKLVLPSDCNLDPSDPLGMLKISDTVAEDYKAPEPAHSQPGVQGKLL